MNSRWSQADTAKGLVRHWTKRDNSRTKQLAATADQHSRFVELMKTSLPIVAVGIIVMAVVSGVMVSNREGISIVFPSLPTVENDLHMLSPKFSGFDSENRPYMVNALTAIQDRDDPNLIRLTTIDGHVVVSTPENPTPDSITELELKANGGLLRSDEQTMELEGNVTLNSNNDYEFITQWAFIEFETNRIHGKKPIAGTGPRGDIQADEFEVTDDGARLLFKGNVQTTIKMDFESSVMRGSLE